MIYIRIFLLLSALFASNIFARESTEFNFAKKVHILSDKAYQNTNKKIFEAVGNVVISHDARDIYGQKATINFETGDVVVIGNVRYVAAGLTLFGSRLFYNLKNQKAKIEKGRIVSEGYTIQGNYFEKGADDIFTIVDGEYSTCKDCPESWAIFGRKIKIIPGRYIYITHAYLKMAGVVALYIPYVVFPIKKGRETGVLFPEISFPLNDEGITVKQPFFWAMSQNSDVTLTPSFYGKRGLGGEFEYRYFKNQNNFFNFNSLGLSDKLFRPGIVSEKEFESSYHRWAYSAEFHHSKSLNSSFHIVAQDLFDQEIPRDFEGYSDDYLSSPIAERSFLSMFRKDWIEFSLYADFNKSLLSSDSRSFDNSMVQTLPRLDFQTRPFVLIDSKIPLFEKLKLTFKGHMVNFKQNHVYEDFSQIRNVRRFSFAPTLDWRLFSIGPLNFSNELTYDFQYYNFPYREEKTFKKTGLVSTSEISFSVSKKFLKSFTTELPRFKFDSVILEDKVETKVEKKSDDYNLIGQMDDVGKKFDDSPIPFVQNSYRHLQKYRLRHFYLLEQQTSGSNVFRSQLQNSDGSLNTKGIFDLYDVIRSGHHQIDDLETLTSLPVSNTFEFRLENFLVRKKTTKLNPLNNGHFIRDFSSFSQIATFHISQGIDMYDDESGVKRSFSDRLTRLFLDGSISVSDFSLSASEYYFWKSQKHIFTTSITKYFAPYGNLEAGVTYNSLLSSVRKVANLSTSLDLIPQYTFETELNFNLEDLQTTRSIYRVRYSPYNNCWKFDFEFQKSEYDESVGINFELNYGQKKF